MPIVQTKVRVFAFQMSNNQPILGGASEITAKWSKDYGTPVALTDTNPTEAEDGFYYFDLTEDERDVSIIGEIFPESSTEGVQVIGVPSYFMYGLSYDDINTIRILNSKIVSTTISIVAPLYTDGTTMEIIQGDDYLEVDGRNIVFTSDLPDQWLDLTDATVMFGVSDGQILKQLEIVSPTGTQQLNLELTKEETFIPQGSYKYDVQATLANQSVITLFRGDLIVIKSYTE